MNIEGILFVEYVCVNKIDPIDEGKNNHGAGILEELIFFNSNRHGGAFMAARSVGADDASSEDSGSVGL